MKQWIDKKPEIRTMSEPEKAWLAATIDGEGSIGLYNFKSGRSVTIQIGNTNRAFVARMKEIIGCGSSILERQYNSTLSNHKGRKPIYFYCLKGSNRCYWVLIQVVDYLIIKKDKAQKIIKELEEKPFGRWVNATPEYRKLHSDRLKLQWQDPIKRRNRIEGMKKFYKNRFDAKKHSKLMKSVWKMKKRVR